VSLVNTNSIAGSSALYLRPMMCPTMFQYMRVGDQTGVQTATVTCTETMGGRWFVSAMSISGAQAPYSIRASSSPFIDVNPGDVTTGSVSSPAGWYANSVSRWGVLMSDGA
jgi:hypothetical protein